ncbi:MAPEG family protein [Cupriavidus metallidurans]|jgi:uncharacterized protein|uniref:Glutathione metabolism protein n=1 Tax=Cupriavidus metallidurans TaxID=119219 RepID=A0A482J311_9BURK|nr:MAPEG family protein [Cupriavidus metallidurans]QBP13474.1 glutathione metabolism protein [Cupriavidus metallidurans]
MQIVPTYSAVLALIYIGLSYRAIRLRRTFGIAIGDGGQEMLLRATRVHSNFAEYVPLNLLLMHFLERTGTNPWFLHALCATLIMGRLLHARGVWQTPEPPGYRVAGMALTFISMIASALMLLTLQLA